VAFAGISLRLTRFQFVVPLPDAVDDDIRRDLRNPLLANAVHTALSFDLNRRGCLDHRRCPIGIMAAAVARAVGCRAMLSSPI